MWMGARTPPQQPQQPQQNNSDSAHNWARRRKGDQGKKANVKTYGVTSSVSWTKVKAALLLHGVLKAWQKGRDWPVGAERVISETVVCAGRGKANARDTGMGQEVVTNGKSRKWTEIGWEGGRKHGQEGDKKCTGAPREGIDSGQEVCRKGTVQSGQRKCCGNAAQAYGRYLCSSLQLHLDQW